MGQDNFFDDFDLYKDSKPEMSEATFLHAKRFYEHNLGLIGVVEELLECTTGRVARGEMKKMRDNIKSEMDFYSDMIEEYFFGPKEPYYGTEWNVGQFNGVSFDGLI